MVKIDSFCRVVDASSTATGKTLYSIMNTQGLQSLRQTDSLLLHSFHRSV
jgi:hypothetical protein